MALPITGQRTPKAVVYKVAACSTAPVVTNADFTNKKSIINQTEMSGKQDGAFAISKASNGALTLMLATGSAPDSTWLPITRAETLTPTAVAALAFTTDLPATQSVAVGAALNLSVAVSGGFTPYTYEWSKGGTKVGGNTATYTVPSAAAGNAGAYVCKVTDASGKVITSKTCNVTVA